MIPLCNVISTAEINAKIEYDTDQNELTISYKFNSFSSDQTGNSFSHAKTFVQDFKVGTKANLLDTISKHEDKYFNLLMKVFGDVDNLFQSIRMAAPITGESITWDSNKMAKIKITKDVQKG